MRTSSPSLSLCSTRFLPLALVVGILLVACGGEEGSTGGGSGGAADATSDGTSGNDGTSGDDATAADDMTAADTSSDDTAAADTSSDDTSGAEDTATADTSVAEDTNSAEDTASADTSVTEDTNSAEDTASADTSVAEDTSSDDTAADTTSDDTTAQDTTPVCTPTEPPTEVCDGLDNDCNGKTDEGDAICTSTSACAVAVCAPCPGGNCGDTKATSACQLQPANEGGACDDGNACTAASVCAKGACTGDAACDDSLACTTDSCDPAQGCSHTPKAGGCDDGNSCTADICDLAAGCTHTDAPGKDGNPPPCDDGDACTGGSACAAGACVGNQPLACDDGKACTADSCDKGKGCVHTALTDGPGSSAPCDDGDACTTGDVCAAGACKAGAAKCDDDNACTTDACDKGTCSNTAIAGCKACKVAGDCDDGKSCTTDSCAGGVCKWAPIAGCVGPTDYTAKALVVTPSPLAVGGAATFKLTVQNLGKAYGGSFSGKMKWDLIFSKDDKIDDGDVKAYTRVWGAYNIGSTKPEATDQAAVSVQAPVGFAHKFACVRIVFSSDANPADNTICTPVTINGGETGLVSINAGSTVQVKGNDQGSTWNLLLSTDNPGNAAVQPTMEVFISADDKLDASDKALVPNGSFLNGPAIPAGKQSVTWKFGLDVFNSTPKGKVWVCLRANKDTAAQETNPDDNVVCGQVEVDNPANLIVDATGLSGLGGPLVPTGAGVKPGFGAYDVPWGAEIGCSQPNLVNAATGNVDKPFAARCFVVWTNNNVNIKTGTFDQAVWSTSWTVSTPISGAAADCSNCWGKATIASTTAVAAKTPMGGAHQLCLEVNHDGAIYETDKQSNIGCTPIKLVGPDLTISSKDSSLPQTLKPGVAATFRFTLQNVGTTAMAGVKDVHKGRLLLSKDGTPSSDDVVLWERVENSWTSYGNGSGKYSFAPDVNKPDIPFTLPANTAPGAYQLLLVVNADGKLLEPLGNNAWGQAVTVQAP